MSETGNRSERGLIHIYCGDGKGKTTAATGLAVRAAGRGKRVVIARFLKTASPMPAGGVEPCVIGKHNMTCRCCRTCSTLLTVGAAGVVTLPIMLIC